MLIAGRHHIESVGLGSAQFAFMGRTAAESVATVHAALDAGVRLIDTALAYTRPGIESYAEQIVACALRGIAGEHPLVATKGGHWRNGDGFPVDARPDTLRVHCEISLRTLETDRIDLYQLHHVDPAVPLSDSVGALEQLRREGKIAAIGLSNVTVTQLDEALTVAPIATVQNRLSYTAPGDLPTAQACARRNVAYLAYMPLGGPRATAPAAALAVAARRGVSEQRVLLAWLQAQAPSIVPIVGASRPASIRDSASPLELEDSDIEDLRTRCTLYRRRAVAGVCERPAWVVCGGAVPGRPAGERLCAVAVAEGAQTAAGIPAADRSDAGGTMERDFAGLTAAEVTVFIVETCPSMGKGTAKLTVTALRSLPGWLHVAREITGPLA